MAGSPSEEPGPFPKPSSPETTAFRARMRDRGRVLSAMARALEDLDPVRSGRGAYLALLGHVFDILNGRQVGIELKDLALLSKIIAEQRLAELRAAGSVPPPSPAGNGNATGEDSRPVGDLPESFGRIVREIYGTNFQADIRLPGQRKRGNAAKSKGRSESG